MKEGREISSNQHDRGVLGSAGAATSTLDDPGTDSRLKCDTSLRISAKEPFLEAQLIWRAVEDDQSTDIAGEVESVVSGGQCTDRIVCGGEWFHARRYVVNTQDGPTIGSELLGICHRDIGTL